MIIILGPPLVDSVGKIARDPMSSFSITFLCLVLLCMICEANMLEDNRMLA